MCSLWESTLTMPYGILTERWLRKMLCIQQNIKKSRCTDENLFSKKLSCKKSAGMYIVLATLYPAAKYVSRWTKSCQEFLNYLKIFTLNPVE